MADIDRLTNLLARFPLRVMSAPLDKASLAVTAGKDGSPQTVFFRARGYGFRLPAHDVLLSARVDWGGDANPLLAALPNEVVFDVGSCQENTGLVSVLHSELQQDRCGAEPVINRLGEVLIVRMLRRLIEQGATEPGLLAGLYDRRIGRAIVAIHDQPGRAWRNEDLADVAGLSLSRFAELFLSIVGEPPAVYLRRWRLMLARQDVMKGDRVDAVARRYGYRSPEGFARAFKKHFGQTPIAERPGLATAAMG
ncbi:MAG: AraC family transcriptional regulator [Cohaesibacteraceae bacterium]